MDASGVPSSVNVVVLVGELCRAPEWRELPSGDHVVGYEVRVSRSGMAAETVPVAWPGAPASAAELAVAAEVVVTGRVRRRFFRAGGSTQSRTEVVADAVILRRHRRRVATAVAKAVAAVGSGDG